MTRHYVRCTEEAVSAVSEIVSMLQRGAVRPLVAFDIETMPLLGLTHYPGWERDTEGKPVEVKKATYLSYVQEKFAENFDLDKLRALGAYLPKKLTNGSEALHELRGEAPPEAPVAFSAKTGKPIKGRAAIEKVTAKRAWEMFSEAVQLLHIDGKLDECKLSGAPLDTRLLVHILVVATEGRIKVDPVEPGLDPFTTEIFSTQFTVELVEGGQLTYVFNHAKVDLEVIRPLLGLKKVTYIAQNAKFDLKHIMHKLGLKAAPRNVMCTKVMSRMLTLGIQMSHSLAALTSRHLGRKMDKLVRDTFIGVRRDEMTPEQIEYGAIDTEVLIPLHDKLMKVARSRGQEDLLVQFSRLSWITAKWELDGYRIDEGQWLKLAAELRVERDRLARELELMLLPPGAALVYGNAATSAPAEDSDDDGDGEEDTRPDAIIRISQRGAVCERLSLVLGVTVTSLSKDARGELEREYRAKHNGEAHPFFKTYAEWAKRAKQVSTYGKKFLWYVHPLTGNAHPSFNIAGTDTARYTSTRPNMLNVPAAKEPGDPDFRAAFLAPEGCYLLGADYESMEMKIAGCVTREPVLQAMFASGADAHTFTAALMFHTKTKGGLKDIEKGIEKFKYGTTIIDIPVWYVPTTWTTVQMATLAQTSEVQTAVAKGVQNKLTRTLAKMVSFLWLFRGTGYTLAMRTGVAQEQADAFMSRFNEVYSTMAAGMDELAERVFEQTITAEDGTVYGYSEAYGGLRRYFELPENPSRRMYPAGYQGDIKFSEAQREYKRRLRSIAREACNVPMQGGNAYITARALNKLVNEASRVGMYPWLAIYDELITVVPNKVKPETAKVLLESAMLEPADEFMTFIPAGAEADVSKVGDHWVKS